jgi:hypothetical protein
MFVTEFFAHFTLGDLSVFDGKDGVKVCASKMLADGFSIICDDCNFHFSPN